MDQTLSELLGDVRADEQTIGNFPGGEHFMKGNGLRRKWSRGGMFVRHAVSR